MKRYLRFLLSVLGVGLLILFWVCTAESTDSLLIRHYSERYPERSPESVQVIAKSDGFALIHDSGARLVLYRYRAIPGRVWVMDSVSGEYAISGGLSVNHLTHSGRHIYFGTCSDSHWNPADDSVTPIRWENLRMVDEDGGAVSLGSPSRGGYLVVLEHPLEDFQVYTEAGVMALDLQAYLQHGYPINECTFP